MTATTTCISVALRLKPAGVGGTSADGGCVEVAESQDGQRALVKVKGKTGNVSEFAFDTVFMDYPSLSCLPDGNRKSASKAIIPNSQKDIFKKVAKPLCEAVLQGMHASIMAYGQTGKGRGREGEAKYE